jgi:hypothetical protein
VIQNGIARLHIAQQIDQRNLIGLRTRQRAHDEVEIGCGEPRPTIRPDHRDCIMRNSPADCKSNVFVTDQHGFTRIRTDEYGESGIHENRKSIFLRSGFPDSNLRQSAAGTEEGG